MNYCSNVQAPNKEDRLTNNQGERKNKTMATILALSIKDLERLSELTQQRNSIPLYEVLVPLNNVEIRIRYIRRMLEKEKGGNKNE